MNKLHVLIVFLFVSLGLQAQVVRHDGVDKEDPKNPTNMDITDQERYESKTFIHEGLSNRIMMEECEKLKDSNACQGRGKTEFMGVDSTMFKMLSQVYAMIIGMGDSKFKAKETKPGATPTPSPTVAPTQTPVAGQNGNANGKEESKEDYCRYVAVATEMGGQLMQQMQQSRISSTATPGENVQKTQLYKAAASHRAKATTSTIAAIGWGGTFGCYAYMGTMGGIVTDGFYFLKLAGAGLMTSFYLSEIKKNNEYADEVSAIADKLPGAGDCNRVTQNDCYCAQPETMYDPQYCMQNLHNKNIGKESIRMTCVDDQLKADPQCRCLASDSCFDKQFMSMVGGTNFGNAFLGSPDGDAFKALARGELKGGKTVMASPSQAAARHNNRMKDVANQLGIPDASVPSNMKGGLASLQAMGLPTSLAKTIAGSSIKIPGADKYVGKFQSAYATPKFTSYSRSGARSLNYGGGNNFRKSNNNGGFENPFDKLNKGKSRTASSVNTLEFAQQATEKAQITQDKGRPLFEIISRRYQISGLRRLNIE
ncbi:MAG: hypothetical protein Fur0010_22590 [Bdellovibrio sp.]